MNKEQELLAAITILEKDYNISRDVLLEAIENSLITACKNHFGKADNVKVIINHDTCAYSLYMEKEVVEEVEDPVLQISLADARMMKPSYNIGDIVQVSIDSHNFGRIATQNAKNVILQKIREESRKSQLNEWQCREREVVTGIVQRYIGRNVSLDLGKIDAILPESEQIRGETFQKTERVKVFILEVKDNPKGPRISVSRTHPDLVRRLFEEEIAEVRDGTVEIRAIAREAGSRTKIAVSTNDPNVDPVGACVGLNGSRVNAVVHELHGEKIDIINWDDNPAFLIENALSPAKVISVVADEDAKEAQVVVPDYQLSLAIGKEGQNARLAARLTTYKIDIKSETQARELGLFDAMEYGEDYEEYENGYYEEGTGEGGYPQDGYGEVPADGGYADGGYGEAPADGGYADGGYGEAPADGGYADGGYGEAPAEGSDSDGEDSEAPAHVNFGEEDYRELQPDGGYAGEQANEEPARARHAENDFRAFPTE